jgi:hypothetical protein
MPTKERPTPDKEITGPIFLELLDSREDQVRQEILSLQITLADILDTRCKIDTAISRDLRVRYYFSGENLKITTSVKPEMGFKPRN